MTDNKQHDPCRVRLFQERYRDHRRRQNGAGTGSGSRCYTGADLSGMSRAWKKRPRRGAWPLELEYRLFIINSLNFEDYRPRSI